MNRNRRLIVVPVALIVCVIAVIASTRAGRAALSKMLPGARPGAAPSALAPTAPPPGDLEQQVRARHGWNSSLLNSVITGQITFFDRDGQTRGQANFTLSRKYPELMRLVIDRGTSTDTVGFDRSRCWKAGIRAVSEPEARDIRAWLRFWPERLFALRATGASYREAGPRFEESRPATPFQGPARFDPPLELQQIEIGDDIGPADQRAVYYYIDQSTLQIRSARWLEPDDPRRTDGEAPKMDSRVDFGNWVTLGGVMWPTQITRWLGGRVEFRIEVTDVKVNQVLSDAIFQGP